MYLIIEELLGIVRITALGDYTVMVAKFAEIKPHGSYKYVLVKVEQVTDWKKAI